MNPIIFETKYNPTFADLDPFGHMNNEVYVSYFMRHRFDGLRERLGLDMSAFAKLPFIFVIKSLKVDYLKPIVGDREFTVTSHAETFGGAVAEVLCEMKTGDKVNATCRFELVCIDKATMKPMDWPEEFTAKFFE